MGVWRDGGSGREYAIACQLMAFWATTVLGKAAYLVDPEDETLACPLVALQPSTLGPIYYSY